jgi:hypothetical protein
VKKSGCVFALLLSLLMALPAQAGALLIESASIDKNILNLDDPSDEIVLTIQMLQFAYVRIDLRTLDGDYRVLSGPVRADDDFIWRINGLAYQFKTPASNPAESIIISASPTADGTYAVEYTFPVITTGGVTPNLDSDSNVTAAKINKTTMVRDDPADLIILFLKLNEPAYVRVELHTLDADNLVVNGLLQTNDFFQDISGTSYISSAPAANFTESITISTRKSMTDQWKLEKIFPIITSMTGDPDPNGYVESAGISKSTLVRGDPADSIILSLRLKEHAFAKIELHTADTDYVVAYLQADKGANIFTDINCQNYLSITPAANAYESIVVSISRTGAENSYVEERTFYITTSLTANPSPHPYPGTVDSDDGGGGCNAGFFLLPFGLICCMLRAVARSKNN